MKNKKVKIFIGFSEVANYYTNLLKGFRELDIYYTFLTYSENIRHYGGDVKITTNQRILHLITSNLIKYKNNKLIYTIYLVCFYAMRVYLFIWALFSHNVFIFSYNASFLGGYDLPILKFFNKKIIYIYHGSDNRPPYLSGNYILENYSLNQIFNITKKLYYKNKNIDKYSDYIISIPPTSLFFKSNMIHFLAIGLPIDLNQIKLIDKTDNNRLIKIIHAPSVKKQKGSDIFSKIIEELKSEGYKIDYEELHNLPNSIVLEKLATCDFVLDELYSDTALAGLATEAAYFGKPTIVGGYYRDIEKDLKTIPVPPSLYVEPDKIKEAIIKLIDDTEYRKQLGRDVENYIKTYWTPKKVASRYLKLISDDVSNELIYNPKESNYFYGWGVSKNDLKEFLQKYIEKFGEQGLFLEHNQSLIKKIIFFIKE